MIRADRWFVVGLVTSLVLLALRSLGVAIPWVVVIAPVALVLLFFLCCFAVMLVEVMAFRARGWWRKEGGEE